jgi:phosphomethylpyrimidine synthase
LNTGYVEEVARREKVGVAALTKDIDSGRVVILGNSCRASVIPTGIGAMLKVKVNANIGTSQDHAKPELELQKTWVAVRAGADTIMDLSTGGDIDDIRRRIIDSADVPLGTVPVYQAGIEAVKKYGRITDMTENDIFTVIEKQMKDGVDFITVHCGVNRKSSEIVMKNTRIIPIVSRGGAFHLEWISTHGKENPLYEHYDRLLEMAKAFNVTLSLGDGFRPGCLHDATDTVQIQELIVLSELVQRARSAGVQVMVEGPGHVPLGQIKANVLMEKKICDGAPFYVLGPIVTDVAMGYDHIAAAIGGAIAASSGADFLCYVTPSEHIGLPMPEDVREGVMAFRIAAHSADISRGYPGAADWDLDISRARKELNWDKMIELAIDPERAAQMRKANFPADDEVCTMCGDFCAVRRGDRVSQQDKSEK